MHMHTYTHKHTHIHTHYTYPEGGEANGYDNKTDAIHDEGHGVVVVSLKADVWGHYLIVEIFYIQCHVLSV